MNQKPHVIVIGAGAFGGWTALHLVRRGARVTLLDAWGPGNSRASSGGETRVIRGTYGPRRVYTVMTARAFGTPPGDARFQEGALPVWADHGARFMYGIPGNHWRGFKVADDTRGPPFDPTTGERVVTPGGLQAARGTGSSMGRRSENTWPT